MKKSSQPSPSKLVARFDSQLKNILMEDLKAHKAKNQFLNNNNQSVLQNRLSAA